MKETIIESQWFPQDEAIHTCSIYGKIIYSYDIFHVPDLYNISVVSTLDTNWFFLNHIVKEIFKDSANDELALTSKTGLHTFMDISQGENYKKDYYIIVSQWQEERINVDTNSWSYVSYFSYISWIYTEKPTNFDSFPECKWFQTQSSYESTFPFLWCFLWVLIILGVWGVFWCRKIRREKDKRFLWVFK